MTQLAFLKSEKKFLLKSMEPQSPSDTMFLDIIELKQTPTDMLLVDESVNTEMITDLLEDQKRFYPILNAKDFNITAEQFEYMDRVELNGLLETTRSKWCLANNLQSIETLVTTATYLKDLWVNDRNSALEEIWFFLKRNLAASEITIIFNDLREPTEKQKEKGEKAKLCQSFLQGFKIPNFFDGTATEEKLMEAYHQDFHETFEITEFVPEKSQFVATAKISNSPLIIMAKLSQLSTLQKNLVTGLINGLQ